MKYYILNLSIEIGDGYEFSDNEYIPIYIYKDEASALVGQENNEVLLQLCVKELCNLPPRKIWADFYKGNLRELVDEADEAYDKHCKDLFNQKQEIFKKYNFPTSLGYYDIERLGEADFIVTECNGD